MAEYIIGAVAASAAAFAVVYGLTPALIRYLTNHNSTVPDVHKRDRPQVARPGGIIIIAGILVSEAILFGFVQNVSILAIMFTSLLAFIVGYIDDKKVMGGWFKPLALAAAAVPIILLGTYETDLAFPLFGDVKIPLLYLGVVVLIIPITGNTINSIDILNGVASGFMVIASMSLSLSLFIVGNHEIAVASLPLVFVSLAFYRYHRNPSRIFPGDSGALTLGAMYGTLTIVGGVEIVAAVALLPAIVNSFLFLSSVKRFAEHRTIHLKPVVATDDFKLRAKRDPRAPITLLRIIVSRMPLTDIQVSHVIFRLAAFSGVLAVISAYLMGVRI